jgi:outer membrane protein assembly factor BamB
MTHRLGIVAALVLVAGIARAEDWPQWRGPHFNGFSNASHLPAELDEAHQLWKVPLPGPGAGTPIVSGEHVFMTCLDAQSKKLLAMCFSRKDGREQWRKEIGSGFQMNPRNNMASPSPVTDGKTVWFYFGTGDLAAFDVQGNPLWSRNIAKDHGPFNIQWIYASSPLLYQDKLYIQVLHRDVPPHGGPSPSSKADSFLLALDPASGKDLWKVVRPNDAVQETKESYATPLPYEHDGHAEILLIGGDCVTAHDPQTGRELWRFGGWNPNKIEHWRQVTGLVATDGLVFACVPKGGPIFAIKDGGSGDVTSTHQAWKSTDISSDVCVPLVYKDRLYVLDGDKRAITCVDPKTGEKKWTGRLGGNPVFRASPTGADDKIYCMNEAGDVWVLAADEFKVLSKASFQGTNSRASISVADGQVFVRAGETMYAFGNK